MVYKVLSIPMMDIEDRSDQLIFLVSHMIPTLSLRTTSSRGSILFTDSTVRYHDNQHVSHGRFPQGMTCYRRYTKFVVFVFKLFVVYIKYLLLYVYAYVYVYS